MRLSFIFALLALPCLTACAGQDAAAGGPDGEVSAPSIVAEQSTWAEGGTIPSGKAGVADIRILKVHSNGAGSVCGMGRMASLKYKAMREDGSVLDPGRKPFDFQVGSGRAIPGWDVVVSKMRVGDSFTIWLPQELAYGPSRGHLKFDMELLSVR
ncbi:MAG: FKBP-type peptidyl-prolyl cis-trans isomerase [Planctomycetota bacterium]|jgi:FKBP-type peptidyl-prolyl cis-trans isomerase